MIKNHTKQYHDFMRLMKELGTNIPDSMGTLEELHKSNTKDGVLDSNTKDLIAPGKAITERYDGCMAFYVQDALQSRATSEETLETIGVADLMDGGPTVLYGCEASKVLNQFSVI